MAFTYKINDVYTLQNEFVKANRDYYSLEGYEALLNLTDEIGDIELDPIAISCEFTEASKDDIIADYGYMMTEDEKNDNVLFLDFLNYHTWAVELENGSYLYQEF